MLSNPELIKLNFPEISKFLSSAAHASLRVALLSGALLSLLSGLGKVVPVYEKEIYRDISFISEFHFNFAISLVSLEK
jgi:hypothetical protein